jgi:hypothetical protein
MIEVLPPRPANTFVQNWIKCLYSLFTFADVTNVTDVAGNTTRVLTNQYDVLQMNAGSTVTTFGIVIGNQVGPTAVALTDTKLQAQVTANITHGAMVFSLNAPDGTHYQLIASRMFTNATGSTLAITEVGIYVKNPATGYFFCVDRTLMTINVANGAAVTLTYTWTTHT